MDPRDLRVTQTTYFWLPAASGGAALEANITVVLVLVLVLLLMSFTQNLISSLFSMSNV